MGDFSNSSGDMFYKNEIRISNRVCISLSVCPFMYISLFMSLYVCTLCMSFINVVCVCTLCMSIYVC